MAVRAAWNTPMLFTLHRQFAPGRPTQLSLKFFTWLSTAGDVGCKKKRPEPKAQACFPSSGSRPDPTAFSLALREIPVRPVLTE